MEGLSPVLARDQKAPLTQTVAVSGYEHIPVTPHEHCNESLI